MKLNRPAQEASALMELFVWALDSEVKSLHRITFACAYYRRYQPIQLTFTRTASATEALTAHNTGLTLNIAANYGGRWGYCPWSPDNWRNRCRLECCAPDQIDEERPGQQICMHELALVDLVLGTGESIALVTFCF
ncbi:undecaprenyl diphosphate synthase family protein [Salmonella enterica subsp. enterica serovar Weltevreden]|nr:undecaprenyl diphosphate synthase family protein [Salmonella enterica subsp. enterica serovar Weltevreden]